MTKNKASENEKPPIILESETLQYIVTSENGKSGLRSLDGTVILEPIYDEIEIWQNADQMELSVLYHVVLNSPSSSDQKTIWSKNVEEREQGINELQDEPESKIEKGVYDEYGEKGEKWKKGGNDEQNVKMCMVPLLQDRRNRAHRPIPAAKP